MEHDEADRKRRAVADQPTIASGQGVAPPPPVPPAPAGPAPAGPPYGPGAAPGSGHGHGHGHGPGPSPYGSPAAYGEQGHRQYGNAGGAWGQSAPAQAPAPAPAQAPQPYGRGAGYAPGPAQNPGAAPGFGPGVVGWPGPPPSTGKSVASMVLGIIGIVAASTCWGAFLGIVLSPIALGLGISARRACDRGELGGRGQAVAGFVLGIVGTVLSVVIVALLVVLLTVYDRELGEYDSDPGGGDGPSLDARKGAAVLVLPGTADRGA